MFRQLAAVLAVLTLAGCATQEPPTAPTTAPTAVTPTGASIALVRPSYQLEPMPVSPTWQPEEPMQYVYFDARWKESQGEARIGEWRLVYSVADLTLRVSGQDPANHELLAGDISSPPTSVTMLATQAEMRLVPYGHEQFWVWYLKEPDGRLIVVSGTDSDVVEDFATGLRREPRDVPPSFDVALLPEHFVPMRVDEHAMEFTSSVRCCDGGYVAIFLVEPDPADDRQGTPVTVNGNPGEIIVGEMDIAVHIGLPDGSELQVSASSKVGLDEAQILTIAEGVSVTPAAVPFATV
jgi:hypothetical protein